MIIKLNNTMNNPVKKQAEDINRHFSNGEIQMAMPKYQTITVASKDMREKLP